MDNILAVTSRLPEFWGLLSLSPGDGSPHWGEWGPFYGRGMMGGGMMGWFGHLVGIIFLLVLIAAIVYVARSLGRIGTGVAKTDVSALDILKKRYARGEIDKQEYEEKKKDLSS